jgi:MFS transporter, OFA family, oxalate/formate antiporter
MKHRAFLWALLVMLLVGVFDMTRSISGPLMQKTFSLSYGELGVLFAAVSIGYLIGSSSVGFRLNHVEVKFAVLIGGLITMLGLVLAGMAGHFYIAVAAFALSGVGSGWMEVSVNALIPVLAESKIKASSGSSDAKEFSDDSSQPGQQAGMFNILHGLYGVGAFAFPVVATWLIARLGGWRPLFVILAALLLVVLIGVVATRFPKTRQHQKPLRHSLQQALKQELQPDLEQPLEQELEQPLEQALKQELEQPLKQELTQQQQQPVLAGAVKDSNETEWPHQTLQTHEKGLHFSFTLAGLLVAITAYVMAEVGVGAWLPTYLVHGRQLSLSHSSMYLSGFYATFTIGRLLGHLWISRVGHHRAILWSTVIAFAFIVVGELRTDWTFAFVLAGVGFAVIFPTITAIASETFPNHSGRVLGLLFTSAGIGSMVVSWLIGGIASWFGLNMAFILIPICLAASLIGLWMSKIPPSNAQMEVQ